MTTNEQPQFAVLYVDDEEQALKYFRKGLEKQFQILTATNVNDGLAILEKESARIGVVITDQCMPGRVGTELLAIVKARWPGMIRILTTAYSDINSAIDAVNDGAISKYLTKPVDFVLMKQTLIESLEAFSAQIRKDALLREKTSILRRMIIADRVRSFAELAQGLSHHVRNSITAMGVFLEEVDPATQQAAMASATNNSYSQLWTLANQEQERLVQTLQNVQTSAMPPKLSFENQLTAQQIAERGIAAAQKEVKEMHVNIDIDPTLAMKLDEPSATRLFRDLLTYVARHSSPAAPVSITANTTLPLWNGTAVQFFIKGQGTPWGERDVASFFTPFAFAQNGPSELGLDLLLAFFIAYHHGGDLIVHNDAPHGPGFELLLPVNPAEIARPELQSNLSKRLMSPGVN